MPTSNQLPTTMPTMPAPGDDNYKESTTRIMIFLVELLYPYISKSLAIQTAFIDGHITQFKGVLDGTSEVTLSQSDLDTLLGILNNADAPTSNFTQKHNELAGLLNSINTKENSLSLEIKTTKESMERKLEEENKQSEHGKNKKEGRGLLEQEAKTIINNISKVKEFSNDVASLEAKQYELHTSMYNVYAALSPTQKNQNGVAPTPRAPSSSR